MGFCIYDGPDGLLLDVKIMQNDSLAYKSFVMGGALIVRAVVQGCVFLMSARVLEPDRFGAFTACLAVATIMAQWLESGPVFLVIVDASKDQNGINRHWGRAAGVLGFVQPWMLILTLGIEWLLFHGSMENSTIAMLVVSELGFGVWTSLGLRVLQVSNKMVLMAKLMVVIVSLRLVMLLAVVFAFESIALKSWALAYMVGAIGSQTVMHYVCKYCLGKKIREHVDCKLLMRSLYFSVGGLAGRVRSEADKVVLARLVDPATAGLYAAAHRVAEIFALPLYGFLEAVINKLCINSSLGFESFMRFTRTTLPWPLAFSVAMIFVIYNTAEYIIWLLGNGYVLAVPILQLMSIMPCLMLVRLYVSHALAGSGCNQFYAVIQVVGGTFNMIGNVVLVPAYGWKGAWAAGVSTELIMIVLVLGMLLRGKNERY